MARVLLSVNRKVSHIQSILILNIFFYIRKQNQVHLKVGKTEHRPRSDLIKP